MIHAWALTYVERLLVKAIVAGRYIAKDRKDATASVTATLEEAFATHRHSGTKA
jgi:hypothetical protein